MPGSLVLGGSLAALAVAIVILAIAVLPARPGEGGVAAALAAVARNSTGPLAAELARALQEMQIGKSRTEALRSMAGRTTAPELRSFASALVQAGELGISIAGVLREQAKEMRLRRRQWA